MKLGIMTTAVDIAPLAQKAEMLGFNSFWVPEHPIIPVNIAPKNTQFRMHLEADGTPQPTIHRDSLISALQPQRFDDLWHILSPPSPHPSLAITFWED
jgi:alkanesulfonate monooxygenase SsuD/methylene tetrahydromethanopterin reductase-like flavin-dependent oxidoreductase (luciferase family)